MAYIRKMSQKLFSDFNSVTKAQIIAQIEKDLKGKTYAELSWKIEEGLVIEPVYTRETATPIVVSKSQNDWQICQKYTVLNPENSNKEILQDLNQGISALVIDLTGIENIDIVFFQKLFEGVFIEYVPLHLIATHFSSVDNALKEYCTLKNIQISGTISTDFNTVEISKNNLRSYEIRVENTSIVSGIGNAIHQYIEAIQTKNMPTSFIFFSIKTTGKYFVDIATLRALRLLASQVLLQLEKTDEPFIFCTVPSKFENTTEEKDWNMLRHTTEAMSAAIGGGDALYIESYDGENTAFSKRIAKNIQLILKEETGLHHTIDAASGAYYIDEITRGIAEKSWKYFQEIEN